jgi:D-lactate dehydrogenase
MAKIAIFNVDERIESIFLNLFKGSQLELQLFRNRLDQKIAEGNNDIEGIATALQPNITAELLDALPHLRVISTMSSAFFHIDIKACKARNITVCNVPDYGVNTVAESAFGLIVALVRKFKPAFERADCGNLYREGLMGMDIRGKTIGIVGTGRIGSYMARLANAYGMKIIACDLHPRQELIDKFNTVYKDLEALISESDIITLHVPYNSSTHHLIDERRLNLCKPSAILVNTCPRKVVDTDALLRALNGGRLAGAALDTFEGEEFEILFDEGLIKEGSLASATWMHALDEFDILHSEKAVITPYISYYTIEALHRLLSATAENLKSYFSGNPQNVII